MTCIEDEGEEGAAMTVERPSGAAKVASGKAPIRPRQFEVHSLFVIYRPASSVRPACGSTVSESVPGSVPVPLQSTTSSPTAPASSLVTLA